MERDLYLTEAPQSESPDTTVLPQKQKINIPKSLGKSNDRRNQISKKMLNAFQIEGYYDDKKIRPGISLYKAILETEDKRRQGQFKGPLLKINMHPTLTFTDNANSMIYVQDGMIKTQNYVSYQQYLLKLGKSEQQIRSCSLNPFIISKCSNGISFQNTIIMNNQMGAKILPRSENVLTTLFTLPFAMYPNIIRLYFTPRHIKTCKKNLGYKIISRKQMCQQLFKRKHRIANNFLVNSTNQDTFIATLIKGKALQPCEQMTQSLCDYLEDGLGIKIQEIVVDFIVDQNKVVWFGEIKSVKSVTLTKLWEVGAQEEIQKIAKQNNNQIMCRLCGMLYTRNEMEKLITNKLIYQLSAHLQSRGKKFSDIPHMKKQGMSNVCHLCFQLIKAEHTLIDIERQFATLMNIRQNAVQRVQSKEAKHSQLFFYDEDEFQALGQQTSKYKKWRLFFYIEKIKRIPQMNIDTQNIEVTLQMKFQDQKQKFTKKIKNQNFNPFVDTTKIFSKSVRGSIKRETSKNSSMRIQSAIPLKAHVHQQTLTPITNMIYPQKKSFLNDQTTCITHSQSYFSNDPSNVENINTTIDKSNKNHTNVLASLYQDPMEYADNQAAKYRNGGTSKFSRESSRICQATLPPIPVEKVKMFVFYTKSHQNQGKTILNEEQLQFTLSFNNQKFSGNSSTLKCLKNKQASQRHSLEIYLFDQGKSMKYCNLQLTVGMICDGVYDDQGLGLEKVNNLYWGKNYNCDPLPDQWMQVFTNGQEVPKCNPEKVLEFLQSNNFSTSPPKILQRTSSVNYLESFKSSMMRPFSGIPISSSSSNLKKTSFMRCKTAMQRKSTQKLAQRTHQFNPMDSMVTQQDIVDIDI